MSRKERDIQLGLFNNPEIMKQYRLLCKEAAESPKINTLIRRIEGAGPIMVIDPEEALEDGRNTLLKVEYAVRNGMDVIEVGGSTNKNDAAQIMIPQIRSVIDRVGGDTLLTSFAGSGDQVVEGVRTTFSLWMPQFDKSFRENPHVAEYFGGEYLRVIDRSRKLGVPIIPVTYLLFNAGEKTTVEKVTGIEAIDVSGGVDTDLIMNTINPWLKPNDLVMLELGSGPESWRNLGPVARRVYERTYRRPIVTGGVSSPEKMREITDHIKTPVVVGRDWEKTPSDKFEDSYMRYRAAHPSTRGMR